MHPIRRFARSRPHLRSLGRLVLATSVTVAAAAVSAVVWALCVPTVAAAQTHSLRGIVVRENGAPVSWASVTLSGSQSESVAGLDGTFRIPGLPPGEHTLLVSAQGFRTVERLVRVPGNGSGSGAAPGSDAERKPGDVPASGNPASGPVVRIVLERDPVALDGVTVTGTRKRESVSESPVKVQVVPVGVLQRNATNNLTEAIQYVNGLYNQVDCGVCYTNNIRINGMEGPYTAVLIDGMPLLSSLASVYGLNGINPALIEQIEIIKGPSSTLYGSEAMAGVVNVITKDPRFTPRLAVDASATSDAEANVDFALSTEPGDVSGLLSGNVAYNDRFVDDNGDGFNDFPLNRRGVLFGKADFFDDGVRRGSLSAKYLYEDRFGGVEEWTEAHRGSSTVYGESIYTHRAEVLGSWLPAGSDAFRVEGSYTWHDQDSFYGDTRYDAVQHIAYGNLIWSDRKGSHDVLAGA
ncbi:MAG: TonB-dependent receptor, partial [Gemmatimonadota bacterium]